MTALAGYWALEGGALSPDACGSMLKAQAHYGPDAVAAGAVGDCAIGRNLARLLPEDRHDRQPLIDETGRFGLVADIRIDNRGELAAALDLGQIDAAGMADSQLLFHALLKWGVHCLDRIVGDFAFAFFDSEAQRLALARDPLGQRPLFWHRGRGFLAFASMHSGLHALEAVPRRPDMEALAHFMALLPIEGEASYFEGVNRVEPGHVVTVSRSAVASRRYWAPERRELRLKRFEDYVEAYRFHLDQAVACRLRGADDLVACHLSGGWDSSAVTATAARMRDEGSKVVAFTAVPRRDGAPAAPRNRFGDEGPLAAATAELYPNVEHIMLESSWRSPVADLGRHSALFQRPPFNLLNHVWLSEIRSEARRWGARVLLTGEIGNWTISASPNTILADLVRQRRWRAWAREAGAMLSRGVRLRGVAASSFGPWLPDFAWKRLTPLSSGVRLARQSALHPRLAARFAELQEARELGPASRPKDYFERAIAAFGEMDFGEYRKGILGGWGIDKRDATADRRLIEFCLSLPIEMLAGGGVRRPLARAALADRLPPRVLDERRKGYQAADWHQGMTAHLPEIAALIDDIARGERAASLVDVDLLRRWVRDWPAGGWDRADIIGCYRTALPQALAAGAFALAASR